MKMNIEMDARGEEKNCTFRHMVGEIYKERKKLHFQIYKWKLASENMMAVAKGEMCQSGASVDTFLT